MARWRELFPYEGDMSGLEDAAAKLRLSQERAAAMAESMGGCRDDVLASWSGRSADAWDAMVSVGWLRMGMLGDASGWAASAIGEFLDVIADVKSRWEGIMFDILGIQSDARERGVESTVELDGGVVRAWEDPDWGEPFDSPNRADPWTVRYELEAQLDRIVGLADERRTADADLEEAVLGVVPDSWGSQKAALVAAGFGDINDMTPINLAEAMALRTQFWLSNDRLEGDEAEYLQAYFDSFGADPMVMDLFFTKLGAEGTVELVDAIGDGVGSGGAGQRWLDLGQSVRSGFTAGAGMWSPGKCERWAGDAVDAALDETGGVSALGWLVADTVHPLPVNVAVALANEVDARERGGAVLVDESAQASGQALWLLEHADGEPGAVGAGAARDLSGRVLEALGAHPGAALDWLDDQDERTTYWFTDRDWTLDGFAGPLGLLDGITSDANIGIDPATGGIDTDQQTRQCKAVGQALYDLSRNASLGPDGTIDASVLSSTAVDHLAGVTAWALPAAESGWGSQDMSDAAQGAGYYDGSVYDGNATMPMVAVDTGFFTSMVGAAQSTEVGAGIIRDGIYDYRDALVAAAVLGDKDPELRIREIEAKLTHAGSMIAVEGDNSLRASAHAADARTDAAQGAGVSALLFTGGVVVAPLSPVTAAGAMTYAGGVATVQEAVGGLLAGNPCTDNFDQVRADLSGDFEDAYDHDRLLYLYTGAEVFDVTLDPAPPDVGSPEWEKWYEDMRVRVTEHTSNSYDPGEVPKTIRGDREAQNH